MAVDAGDAFLNIVPRLQNLGGQIQRQLATESGTLSRAGQQAGDAVAQGVERGTGRASAAMGSFRDRARSSLGAVSAAASSASGGLNPLAGSLADVSVGLSQIDRTGPRAGRALLTAGLAATAVGAALTRMGDDSKRATAQLETAIANAGESMEDFEPQIDQVTKRLIQLGFDDEATARSLATLTTATGDTAESLNLMGLAADIAAARHISLESVADKLAKAQTGNTRIFREFGIELSATASASERAAAMAELQARVQGQAAAQADNFSGRLRSLAIQVENVGEAVGGKVGPAITLLGPAIAGVGGIIQSRAIPALITYVRNLVATRAAQDAVGASATRMGTQVGVSNAAMATGGVRAGLFAGGLTFAAAALASFAAKALTSSLGLQKALDAIGIPEWMQRGFNVTVFGPLVEGLDWLTKRTDDHSASLHKQTAAFRASTIESRVTVDSLRLTAEEMDALTLASERAQATTDALAAVAEQAQAKRNAAMRERAAHADQLAKELDRAFAGTATQTQLAQRFAEVQTAALAKVADAERDYADTQQRVSDEVVAAREQAAERLIAATERVAEAEQRAAEQRQSAAERVAEAEQRLADVKERQSASATTGSNPIRERLIARRQELRDAEQAVDEARRDQAATEAQASADVARARQEAVDAERELQDASQMTASQRRDLEQAERDLQSARNEAAADLAKGIQDHIRGLLAIGATMDEIRGAFDGHIEDFRRTAAQMGLNEAQARTLSEKYGLLDRTVTTTVELAGAQAAIDEAERVTNELIAKFGLAEQAAKIGVEIVGAKNAEKAVADILADTTSILPPGYDSGPTIPLGIPGRAQGGLVGAAQGMVVNRPTVLVGEGDPSYPEVVLATDPRYRRQNIGYWEDAGRRLGVMGAPGPGIDYAQLESAFGRAVRSVASAVGPPNVTIVVNGVAEPELPHKVAREFRREMSLSGR